MDRFIVMQKREFSLAFNEIKRGRKINHWIWYIFPQIKGLGHSYFCQKYDIQSLDEAKIYLENEFLRNNLIKISQELLKHKDKDIKEIMNIDDIKLLSCMTLFKEADKEVNKCGPIFQEVINTFYGGKEDERTISILNNQKIEKNKKLDIEEEKIKVNEENKECIKDKDEEDMDIDIGNENISATIKHCERMNTNDLKNLNKEINKNINYNKNRQPNNNIMINNSEKGSMRNYNKNKDNNEKYGYQTHITDFFKKA